MDLILLTFSLLLIITVIPVAAAAKYLHDLSKETDSWLLNMLSRGAFITFITTALISGSLIYGIGRMILGWPTLPSGFLSIVIGISLFVIETVSVKYALIIRKHRKEAQEGVDRTE